jgi:hypothetical protein
MTWYLSGRAMAEWYNTYSPFFLTLITRNPKLIYASCSTGPTLVFRVVTYRLEACINLERIVLSEPFRFGISLIRRSCQSQHETVRTLLVSVSH